MSATSYPNQPKSNAAGFGSLVRLVVQRIEPFWSGPRSWPPHLRLEQRFTAVRFLGVLLIFFTAPLLIPWPDRLLFAYISLFVAAIYVSWVQVLIRRHSPLLEHGYVTTIGDALFCVLFVLIGGGFTTSFYYIVFTATVCSAMRFGYGPSMLVVGGYILLDALEHVVRGNLLMADRGVFLFRSGFLIITTLSASYVREQAQRAEAALALQLGRARALNESTSALNASLKLNTVVQTVVMEARRLLDGEDSAIRLGSEYGGATAYDQDTRDTARDDHQSQHRMDVLALIPNDEYHTRNARTRKGRMPKDRREYLVVALQSSSGVIGHVVVVRWADQPALEQADEELLSSFIDRAVLAIENASLYQTNEDRSRDLQRAYADLASAHQELLDVDEMKTNFIANVSHELRTPLTSIRSFSEILLTFDVNDDTQHEFVEIINTESERLTRLVNDVLDITKIESGQVDWHMEHLDLGDILQSSARIFTPLAEEKGLQLVLTPLAEPICVYADSDRIQQVLANLLGNAIKFTPHGSITLSAELRGDMVSVHIADTGIGIAPSNQERIFEKFLQVGDTLTDKPAGTGLGLCICRDIVQHHGGRIWVDSDLGQGSVFTFTLLPITNETPVAVETPAL
jgi:signal transduction histidine kinase